MIDRETIGFYDRAAQRMGGLDADGLPSPALARFMARLTPGAAGFTECFAEQGQRKGQSGHAEPYIALLLEAAA